MKQVEKKYLGSFNLVSGSVARPGFDIPLGVLYDALHLHITGSIIVAGSPASNTAFANPLLELINKITLKADGKVIYNAPSKAIILKASHNYGTLCRKDETFNPNAAATYDMYAHIPLHFSDKLMIRPEDTILDATRYQRIDLEVGLGSVNDAYKVIGTQGTASLGTFTCYIETEQRQWRDTIKPAFLPRFETEGSYKPTSTGLYLDVGRAMDKALKRAFIFASAVGSSSTPNKNYQGDGSNSIIDVLSLKDENKDYVRNRQDEQLLDDMKLARGWDENMPAGHYVLDLVEDGSNLSALATGDKGTLQVVYEVGNTAAYKIVSLATESLILL